MAIRLPDLTQKVKVDTSDLTRAEARAKAFQAAMDRALQFDDRGATQKLRRLDEAMASASRSAQQANGEFRQLGDITRKYGQAAGGASRSTLRLRDSLAKVQDQSAATRKELDRHALSVENVSDAHHSLARTAGDGNAAMRTVRSGIRGTDADAARLNVTVRKTSNAFRTLRRVATFTGIAVAVPALAQLVPVLAGLGAGVAPVAALAGLLPALGAGLASVVGVTALAVAGNERLKSSFEDFQARMVGVQSAAQRNLTPALEGVLDAIADMEPVVTRAADNISTGLAGALERFSDLLRTRSFQSDFRALTDSFGRNLAPIGAAFTDILQGITSGSAAAIPVIDRMVAGFREGARNFAAFIDQARASGELQDFFDAAYQRARQLWGIIKDVGGLLGDLGSIANRTGLTDEIFGGIERGMSRARDFLRTNAAEVEAAFRNVRRTVESLGPLFAALGRGIITTLSQVNLTPIIDTLTAAVPVAADAIVGLVDILSALAPTVQSLLPIVELFTGGLQILADVVSIIPGPIGAAIAVLLTLNKLNVASKLTGIATGLGLVGTAAGGVTRSAGPAGAAVSSLGVATGGLAASTGAAAAGTGAVAAGASRMGDTANQAARKTGRFAGALRNMGSSIVAGAGGPGMLGAMAGLGALTVAYAGAAEIADLWTKNIEKQLTGMSQAAAKARDPIAALKTQMDDLDTSFGGLADTPAGVVIDTLFDVRPGTGEVLGRLVKDTLALTDARDPLAEKTGVVETKQRALNRAVADYGPTSAQAKQASEELTRAQDELASSQAQVTIATGDVRTQMQGAIDRMRTLREMQLSGEEATQSYHDTVRDLATVWADAQQQANELGVEMINGAGAVNTVTTAGSQLQDTFVGMGDSMQAAYDAAVNNAVAMGDDLPTAMAKGEEAAAALQADWENQLRSLGLTDDQIGVIIDHYGDIPTSVATHVALTSGDTETQLDSIGDALSGLPPNTPITVTGLTEDAADELRELGYQVVELDNGTYTVSMSPDASVAETANQVAEVKKELEQVPKGVPIRVDALTADAVKQLQDAGYTVEELASGEYRVTLTASAEEVQAEIAPILEDLEGLEVGKTVKVDVLSSGAQDALTDLGFEVRQLADGSWVVEVDANTKDGVQEFANLQGTLDDLPTSLDITTTTNASETRARAEALRRSVEGVPTSWSTTTSSNAPEQSQNFAIYGGRVKGVPTSQSTSTWSNALAQAANFLHLAGRVLGVPVSQSTSTWSNALAQAGNFSTLSGRIRGVPRSQSTTTWSNAPAQSSNFAGLSGAVNSVPNSVSTSVSSNATSVDANLRALRGRLAALDGMVATVTVQEQRIGGGPRMADGGIIEAFAGGGLHSNMPAGIARVVPPKTYRVIGDRARDDEAYIPINDSRRSHDILRSAAERMGYDLHRYASGGFEDAADAARATYANFRPRVSNARPQPDSGGGEQPAFYITAQIGQQRLGVVVGTQVERMSRDAAAARARAAVTGIRRPARA